MKIPTNAGEIELTAKMLRPGMVFSLDDEPWCAVSFDDYIECWQSADKTWASAMGLVEFPFLGCDPSIATRDLCERFGIAPGIDAGAHGFARLRGGGAVDLQRPENLVPGMRFRSLDDGPGGGYTTFNGNILAIPDAPSAEERPN